MHVALAILALDTMEGFFAIFAEEIVAPLGTEKDMLKESLRVIERVFTDEMGSFFRWLESFCFLSWRGGDNGQHNYPLEYSKKQYVT